MATPFDIVYMQNKEQVEFFKEITDLIAAQKLRIGQRYSWPEKYFHAWNNGDIQNVLVEVLTGTPFSYNQNGNTVEIT
jgi:hypothetical protein